MAAPARRLHVAEPQSPYLHKPPLVPDASVIAAALFGEAGHAEALALLRGRSLHAPHLLDHEIASVGLKKLRRDGVARQDIAAILGAFQQLPIERHAVDADTVVTIAQRCKLTAYDAAYLCVAAELAAPLATLDERLGAAARAYLSVDQIHGR